MEAQGIWGEASGKLLVAGLTGGIASGKSEVSSILTGLGAFLVDADEVARDVVMPGTGAYRQLVERFGNGILGTDGRIDRLALGRLVFSDREKLTDLNRITHPEVFREISLRVRGYARNRPPGAVPAAVIDAALIVDAGAAALFDLLIVVSSSKDLRLKRLVEHRGMPPYEALSRIESQVPEEQRRQLADIVIENNATLLDLRREVEVAWRRLETVARGRQPA